MNNEEQLSQQTIQIKDLIRSVQLQLIESENERKRNNLPPLFNVKELEIEMSVIIENSANTDCGVSLKILDASHNINIKKEQIHKLRLILSTEEVNSIKYNTQKQSEINNPNSEESDNKLPQILDNLPEGYLPNNQIETLNDNSITKPSIDFESTRNKLNN